MDTKRGEKAEYILQPNHVTNARYEYTLIQERIFTAIMYYLQDTIKDFIKYITPQQLELFKENKEDPTRIKLTIPLKHITRPSDYKSILPAAKKMIEIAISFPYETPAGIDVKILPLITDADRPYGGTRRSGEMMLTITREVAEILINVQKRGNVPVKYTRYVYQIAQNTASKYTSLLYKKIASWKFKGGFTISLKDLYKDICVQGIYQKDGKILYKEIKKNILEKAKNELYQKADCWFEYIENYEGRRVKSVTFKVITPELHSEARPSE